MIHGSLHQSLVFSSSSHLQAPGEGCFTQEADKPRIARTVLQMLWKKLQRLLKKLGKAP